MSPAKMCPAKMSPAKMSPAKMSPAELAANPKLILVSSVTQHCVVLRYVAKCYATLSSVMLCCVVLNYNCVVF